MVSDRLFSSTINQMPESLNWMPVSHAWTGILHYRPNLSPHFRFVAMDGTFGAGRFLLLIRTFVEVFPCIIQKLLAIITKLIFTTMKVMTVHTYHRLDGFLFPIQTWSVGSHIRNPLWKSRLTRFPGQPALLRFYSICSNLAKDGLQVFIRRAYGHDIEIID